MIVKIKKRENPFAMIDRAALEDSRLSWKARGILAYLLSKPEDWEVNIKEIRERGKEGRNVVQACFKELESCGYAELKPKRNKGGQVVGKHWVIHETPINRQTEFGVVGTPTNRKPVNRKTEDRVFGLITNKEENTNNKEQINTHTQTPKPIDEIESGVEMNDPFLFQTVAQKMADFLSINPGQWERMKHDTGYTGTAYDICLTWAGKQDKYTLTRWPQHIGKLTTWMKNESKNQSNGTNNNTGRTSQNDQRRKGETSQRALSIRERAARL